MIGQLVLNKYKITRRLDQGGMSMIYLARQMDQNRDVVVKVLQDTLLSQPKAREHFIREIYITSRFQHIHAVSYIDSSVKESTGPVLVMEFLRGIDLHGLLEREGRLSLERAGRLLAQLCDVLQAAHDAGIVHRDIKPGNLMILNHGTPQETLKLMDFGLAKMSSMLYIAPEDLIDFTLPAAAGTPEYISPEQVRGSEMDGRGDLYSVGVILFEMLTGRRPFTHPDVDQLLLAHANEKPPTFTEVGVTDVPPAIEDVVRSCLEKFPDHRPRNALDLLQRYEQALGRRVSVPRTATPPKANGSNPGLPINGPAKTLHSTRPSTPAPGRGALEHRVHAVMCEAMALIKLKGFIYDLGGEVLESEPGMIKVRVPESDVQKSGGFLGWRKLGRTAATEVELHMERSDPGQPNNLTITLLMRPAGGSVTSEWQARGKRLGQDLQAYLMGR